MIYDSKLLPVSLLLLLPFCDAFSLPRWNTNTPRSFDPQSRIVETNPDGSQYVWVLEDTYAGDTFFDNFTFWDLPDPTNGHVNYQSREDSFSKNLAYVDEHGSVIMKSDNTTWLPEGTYRDSVRIQSNKLYNTGSLFILDINTAPWGCAIWPAFWTVGVGNWPLTGEIDIIEGVHDNEHNQVAWHTGPDCYLDTAANFSGTPGYHPGDSEDRRACYGLINDNAGCSTTQWSKASYGANFDATGGGAFVMKWDENGIGVWSFYRAAIPNDINEGSPTPSNWDIPVALLTQTACNFTENFIDHTIVFDITFCGDWAGNSYETTDCPGTCPQRLMDPKNFDNATWSINYLRVYKKLSFSGNITNGGAHGTSWAPQTLGGLLLSLATLFLL